jgi:histidyl-tRNA synthetase
LRHADRVGARYTAIIGEGGEVTLRDMTTGGQRDVALSEVIGAIT